MKIFNRKYANIEKVFIESFKRDCFSKVRQLEEERKKLLLRLEKMHKNEEILIRAGRISFFLSLIMLSILFLIGIFIAILSKFIDIPTSLENTPTGYFATFVSILCSLWYSLLIIIPIYQHRIESVSKKFKNSINPVVMPTICKAIGNISWYPSISKRDVSKYNKLAAEAGYIYHKGINNVFRGNYEGIPYEIVSSNYSVQVISRYKHYNYKTHFNRIIVSLDLKKNFRSRTLIKRNCGIVHIFGLRRIPIDDLFIDKDNFLKNTSVSIEGFNDGKIPFQDIIKIFKASYGVFTNNKQDAMSLVTPEFIDAFTKLRLAFGVERVDCAFYEGKFLFALDAEREFCEINSLSESLLDETQYEGMLNEITSIFGLIDQMKSSLKI